MDRKELDAFVAHHQLASAAVEAALDIAGARASAMEIRQFTTRLLRLAGVLSLAAGVIFFIAANWQELGVAGRFALVQAVLVVSVALAFAKPPPQSVGRHALLMAFIATGAVLALFGQTYQTGADVYELFLTWTVLGLPFVVAGRWSAICAAWLAVFNLALLLFFGWKSQGGWLWAVFSPWRASPAALLLVPTAFNLILWLLAKYLGRSHSSTLAPRWIARLALTCAFGFSTWAGVAAVVEQRIGADHVMVLLVVCGVDAAIAAHTLRTRSDVFPLALTAASLIVLSTCALATHASSGDLGMFLMLSLWLIVSSTISGRILMSLVRAWRHEQEPA